MLLTADDIIMHLIDAAFFTKQQWPPVVIFGHHARQLSFRLGYDRLRSKFATWQIEM